MLALGTICCVKLGYGALYGGFITVFKAEYLNSDMAAPESINALYHFPACTFMVGQSIIHATLLISSTGGPPHSWGALLREGKASLI